MMSYLFIWFQFYWSTNQTNYSKPSHFHVKLIWHLFISPADTICVAVQCNTMRSHKFKCQKIHMVYVTFTSPELCVDIDIKNVKYWINKANAFSWIYATVKNTSVWILRYILLTYLVSFHVFVVSILRVTH